MDPGLPPFVSSSRDVPGPRLGIGERLVIADDSAAMRWLVRETIGDDFGEVVEVADGRALFWTLLQAAYQGTTRRSLVVADLYMPAYDGLAVLEAWRELEREVPAVLITAFPSDEVALRARALGLPVLAKPFPPSALRAVIREARRGRPT